MITLSIKKWALPATMLLSYSYATGALLQDDNSDSKKYSPQAVKKIQNYPELFFYLVDRRDILPIKSLNIQKENRRLATSLCEKIVQLLTDEEGLNALLYILSKSYDHIDTFKSILFKTFADKKKLSGPIIKALKTKEFYETTTFLTIPEDLIEAYLECIDDKTKFIQTVASLHNVRECSLKTFKHIIEKFPDITKEKDVDGDTLLHYVAFKTKHANSLEERIRILKDNGASVSDRNLSSKTALDIYLNRGSTVTHETIIKLLTPPSNNNSDNNNNGSK